MRSIFIIALLFPTVIFSQINNFGRTHSDILPDNFKLDAAKLRDHIYAGIPNSIKKGEYPRRAIHFAQENANWVCDLISSGQIYSDWMPLENYLNEILKKVTPKELMKDSVIHAYVIQDGDYNAAMAPSGHIFINIGLFTEVANEAEIAGILSHELAHYYLRHSLYTFLAIESGDFDGMFRKGESKYSVKNELQADSLAMAWLYNSEYNIGGLISSFKTMYRLERKELKESKDKWKLEETTHPLSQKRLERLNDFYNQHKSNPGKNFLIDETKFNTYKEEAKPEILKCLLNDFDYYSCIETAFRFHIFDPDNKTYVYYLMEGMRRNCYLDVTLWNKMFITNRYYDSVSVNDNRHKEPMTDHLFKKFDLDIIPIVPSDGVKIKAKFYWKDKPRFTTYEEAFVFFYNLGKNLECHECILSNALSITKDKTLRNKLLDEYLKYPDIKYKEFAENMIAETITKKLNNQKLLAFSDVETIVKQGYEKIPLLVPYAQKTNGWSIIFDSVMNAQKNCTPVFMSTFKNNNLTDYKMLSELQNFSFIAIVSKGEKTELHILNPDFWNFFHKYNVNEIEFINCRYYEEHAKDKSLQAYEHIINQDYNSIFLTTPYTKYLEIFISSVREIEDGVMKIRFYDKDNGIDELKSKEAVDKQAVSLIKHELVMKEKIAKDIDEKYKYSLTH